MTLVKECKKIQESLIDSFYGESKMSEEIDMHLKECVECSSFYQSLYDMKHEMSVLDTSVEVDMEGIRKAFQVAEERQKVQKKWKEFSIFLFVVFTIMSFVVGIAVMGYGTAVIIGQLSVAAITPILIPLLFIRKLGKEGT